MRRFIITLAVLGLGAVPALPPAAAHAQAESADVSVSMAWVGHGSPRINVGGQATYAITVSNHGPSAATGVVLTPGVADQFGIVSLTCAQPQVCSEPGGGLAAGASTTATLVTRVCCFPPTEVRVASVAVTVTTTSVDPDLTNNQAFVNTRILGPHF